MVKPKKKKQCMEVRARSIATKSEKLSKEVPIDRVWARITLHFTCGNSTTIRFFSIMKTSSYWLCPLNLFFTFTFLDVYRLTRSELDSINYLNLLKHWDVTYNCQCIIEAYIQVEGEWDKTFVWIETTCSTRYKGLNHVIKSFNKPRR